MSECCNACDNYFKIRSLWMEDQLKIKTMSEHLRLLGKAHEKTLRKYRALRLDRDNFRREMDRLAEGTK